LAARQVLCQFTEPPANSATLRHFSALVRDHSGEFSRHHRLCNATISASRAASSESLGASPPAAFHITRELAYIALSE
jgi:hypothetical protein